MSYGLVACPRSPHFVFLCREVGVLQRLLVSTAVRRSTMPTFYMRRVSLKDALRDADNHGAMRCASYPIDTRR